MTDRPILFSGPMVRAILDGRKTQTRRVLKPQPCGHPFQGDDGAWNESWEDGRLSCGGAEREVTRPLRLRYQPGDRLWVREAWCDASTGGASTDTIYFRASPDDVRFNRKDGSWGAEGPSRFATAPTRWRPGIHMPRWASRLTLIVEAVKVGRLQDISEQDAIAEGVVYDQTTDLYGVAGFESDTATGAFCSLWMSINGADSWASNPWVAAISFRTVKANIDQMEDAR